MEEQIVEPVSISESPVPVEKKKIKPVFIFIFIGIFGIVSGWGLSRLSSGGEGENGGSVFSSGKGESGDKVKVGETYGEGGAEFTDKAIGVIEKNGTAGEGTHKLLREGGESQTAYLTSSILDLDLFVGHKVEVLGQTFKSQKVGWLMDIGQVKVLE